MTGRAIVIGASMGGLLAARALADSFREVIVLDRDELPETVGYRKGVAQGRHTHVLLLEGCAVLESLFPGLTAELMGQGAPLATPETLIWFDGGGYHARFTAENRGALMVSRPLLEGSVRARIRALPKVWILDQCDVQGLLAAPGGRRVQGVRVLRRPGDAGEESLTADLVVDASGRGSQAGRWLAELGYLRPQESQVVVKVGYATRLFRRRPEHLGGARAVVIAPSPETKRGGVMMAQEGDRWTVSLAGMGGDYPPVDEEGFLAFAQSLRAPEIYQVVREAEPLSDGLPYRFPASLRRRYERLNRFPEGFLVFGDAICSFNPIYGQGMSVAALEARDLQRCLARGVDGLWRRFFRRAARTLENPWQIVVSGDVRYPEAEGERTPAIRLINAYMARVHAAARHDPAVARAFNAVAGPGRPGEGARAGGAGIRRRMVEAERFPGHHRGFTRSCPAYGSCRGPGSSTCRSCVACL